MSPRAWLEEHRIEEVECLVPDPTGIARGKLLPTARFLKSIEADTLRLPESIFYQTVTGDEPDPYPGDPTSPDVILRPDVDSLRLVPWYDEPTAQVLCDAEWSDGSPVGLAPRQVLRRVLALYAEKGWRPVVAPELEFYLVAANPDPDEPLSAPLGRSGRPESGRQAYGIDAVNEFDPVLDDMYDYCEAAGIEIDTLIHETGPAQLEINFEHGDALVLADNVLLFKRALREAALNHGVHATFMAKPIEGEAGSAMHIHQSVVDAATGETVFADPDGTDRTLFRHHIGGLQHYLPRAMALFAPNVNSYRRLRADSDAPINTHWGRENRTVGLRVPASGAAARRVENRVAGVDANPYLAMAGTLACGWLGMVEDREPTKPFQGNAYASRGRALPRQLPDALARLSRCEPLKEALGADFVRAYIAVKRCEYGAYQDVISPWEREHLLLNV